MFDCKTTAFVAFMAAVTLILSLSPAITPVLNEGRNFFLLIQSIFNREEKEGCRITGQCCKMLVVLLELCDLTVFGRYCVIIVFFYNG